MTDAGNEIQKNLFREMGLEDLPRDKKMELMVKWGDIVQKDVIIRLIQEMSEESKKELDDLLARDKSWDEIYEFLEGKFGDLEEVVQEETKKFRTELIEDARSLGFKEKEEEE